MNSVASVLGEVTGPKYDGRYIRSLAKMLLRNITIRQTLTDVVIPAFDIRRLQPIIFSTAQVYLSIYMTLQNFKFLIVTCFGFFRLGKRDCLEKSSFGRCMYKHISRSNIFPTILF